MMDEFARQMAVFLLGLICGLFIWALSRKTEKIEQIIPPLEPFVISLGEKDVLVFTTPQVLTQKDVERMREELKDKFSGRTVLTISGDFRVGVIKHETQRTVDSRESK